MPSSCFSKFSLQSSSFTNAVAKDLNKNKIATCRSSWSSQRMRTASIRRTLAKLENRKEVNNSETSNNSKLFINSGLEKALFERRISSRREASTEAGDGETSNAARSWKSQIPTLLTLTRVVVVPVLVAIYFLPGPWVPDACAGMFLAAAFTDWLDGYLARKWNVVSAFGAFLDPVADKLMVTTALILLCTKLPAGLGTQYPWFLPLSAIIIIAREITMSALREWAASAGGEAHKAVAVNSIGKWKTATQMTALTLMLLLRDANPTASALVIFGTTSGAILLMIANLLTVWSLAVYLKNALKYMST
mmetsp:Transcript_29873/g.41329  ORF Transcript_29873/g.41329 Transcript_29873/m.41329 type:complete len:306 (-) Transcript_29873:132-1049(-)|eukprot:CAMPEP_0196589626 /NCGR_PEP_ID=MMETSP1081-20130531/64105_1 /TAXON_ID=36882 /ORGANISM="Pyramimonas amylifera, Strain CCMP720" /LENGTH=305 /DNA_ID=CAMNT_0041912479 /DNA_START=61 /DNA_END=978 /DNA_ORIENTATION=-